MTLVVTPTVADVFTKVRALVVGIVPVGTIVLRGPLNRTAAPAADHVILTPVHRARLRTNVDTFTDPFPLAGSVAMEQGTKLEIQADFYGANSGDWAAMFSTVWRDEYAVTALAPACAPLYADDGRQVPLVTGEEQYLERWAVRAVLQYNPVTTAPQEFADAAEVTLIDVDVEYPPT